MRKVRYLFILLALACGSGNGASSEECDLSGTWEVTYALGAGDCVDPGEEIVDTITITEDTVKDSHGEYPVTEFDEDACSVDATYEEEEAETPDTYGTISTFRVKLTFDGDEVSGSAKMSIEWTELGVVVDSCTRAYEIEGSR